MDDKYQELYGYMRSQNLTDLDAQTFFSAYSKPEKFESLWSYVVEQDLTDLSKDMFYDAYFGSVKKKPDSEQGSPLEEVSTESTSDTDPVEPIELGDSDYGVAKPKEKQFLQGFAGNFINAMPIVGDFADDIARALARGSSRNKSIDETYKLMAGKANVDLENVSKYVEAINSYNAEVERIGPSDEMNSYSEAVEGYKKKHGAWFGTFRAIAENPGVLPEVMAESMAGMVNGRSLKEAGKVVGLGTGVGAAAGAPVGGIGAGPGAVVGAARSLPFAMAAAGYEVEALSSFTEFLNEELGDREMTPENVLSVLSDDEAYKRIRNRAVKRGKTISAIDAIGGAVLARSFRAVKATSKLAQTGVVGGEALGEAALGSAGESAARVAADQPQVAEEIIMEGAAGLAGLPATLASTYLGEKRTKDIEVTQQPIREAVDVTEKPVYSVNEDEVDLETLMDFVNTSTAEELKAANIKIDNDPATADKVANRVKRSLIEEVLPGSITEEDKNRLVDLEEERQRLVSSNTQTAKRKLAAVDSEIETINARYDEPITPAQEEPGAPTVSEQLNRIVVMEDGTRGELRRDTEYGDRVVIETEDKIIDLGNADEVMDNPISNLNLTEDKSQIEVTPDGNILYDGNEFGIQRDLPTRGIEYNEQGEVTRVSLKDSEGNTTMLEGQSAQDAAYQILLDQVQTPEQEQRINELLEQDEEFQREHDGYVRRKQEDLEGGAQAVIEDAEVEADQVPEQTSGKPVFELIQEDKPKVDREDAVVEDQAQREQARQELDEKRREEDIYTKQPALKKFLNTPKKFFADILTGRSGFQRRFFSARKYLPKSTFQAKEAKDARIAKILNVVDQSTNKFNRIYKAVPQENQQQFVNDFDNYLRGGEVGMLEGDALDLANEIRTQIDRLSIELINQGVVQESQIDKVIGNIGQYLTRSYRVFDDPKALRAELEAEEGQRTINKAKNLIRERERAQAMVDAKNPDMNPQGLDEEAYLESVVNGYIEKYLDKDSAGDFVSSSRLGSKDLNILKAQKDIPMEIRALMGEYTDPMQNYARSVLRMVSAAEGARFLNSVKKMGQGVFLFDTPREGFTAQIAAEGSESMSPLNGLYTTKEIAESFQGEISQANKALELYMKLIATVKWTKTIASVGTHFKNVFGNIGFIFANGHYDFTQMGEAYRIVKNDLKSRNKQELNDKLNKYIELGIVKQSAGLGEIRDMFKDANFDDALVNRLSDQRLMNETNKLKKAGQFIKRKGLQGKRKLENLYQAEDDFFKIVAFENEKNRYSKAMFGKKPSELNADQTAQLDAKVAEIVKNTYPTYSRVPEAIQMLRRSPLIGNFVSFQAESYRVAYNTLAIAKKEITEGARTGNKKLQRIGARRLFGATSYVGAKSGIVGYFGLAAGTGVMGIAGKFKDSEEEKEKQDDIKSFVAPWSKNSDLVLYGVEDGKFSYIDVSASDPYGGLNKVANALTTNGFAKGLTEIFEPFLDTDIATQRLLNMYSNKDDYGRDIYNPEDTDVNKAQALVSYAYNIFEPGTVTSIRKVYNAERQLGELLGQTTGMKPYHVDVLKQSQFKIKELANRLPDVNKLKYEDVDQANEAAKAVHLELYELTQRAQRLGVSRNDIGKALEDWGRFSRKKTMRILNNIYTPINYVPKED